MAETFRTKVLPVGIVQEVVNTDNLIVRVKSQDYGTIDIFMASTDPVAAGEEIYVIPLAGGRIIGAVKTLQGLGENFEEVEGCRTVTL